MIIEATATMSASIAVSAVAKEGSNLLCRPQYDQHQTRVAGFDHDQPLASAKSDPANANPIGFSHGRPDHPKGLIRNPAVRIDVIRGAEINRIDLGARDEGFKVDDLRAFDI